MVRWSLEVALLVLLLSERTTSAYVISFPKLPCRTAADRGRRYVASSLPEHSFPEEMGNSGGADLRSAMSNITASYIDYMSMEDDTEDQAAQRRLGQRASSQRPLSVFRAQFDLSQPIGLSLTQVKNGKRLSDVELDLDVILGNVKGQKDTTVGTPDRQRMDWPVVAGRLNVEYKGLLVSSVVQGGAAWEMGVRPGDMLNSVSATLGGALWPTSTLDGIQSSLQGRKYTSDFVFFEFGRTVELIPNRYELTLKRPLGIEVQETEDGFVVVTGFCDSASNLVRRAVKPGDRVLAVDSSLGGSMWPVTTVAGLTSACTSRFPGASVTLQLQRPLENMQSAVEYSAGPSGLASPLVVVGTIETPVDGSVLPQAQVGKEDLMDKKVLIKRCRDILDRYSVKSDAKVVSAFKNKYDFPAIVADKVVDALASANVALDSLTLSMIMRAYLSCKQPESAIQVFEAAVGFRGDATCFNIAEALVGNNGKGLAATESALSLYTGTALLQAHAMKGDLHSVCRVLASLEGRSGVVVNGLESAPWPFTGVYGSIQPDTRCYNIAISAAARIGGMEALDTALSLFDDMTKPKNTNEEKRKPERDVVSYNTMISALSAAGLSMEAFRVFDRMKQSKVRPDKYTYTPLIRVCQNDGDVEELLYDMKENNIQLDTVTYNTMIRSLCEKRRWTEASKLVTEMESSGVSPDSRTYGTLMSAMLKADKPTTCLTLFESACSSSKTASLTENVFLYTTAITAASALGDYERAIDLLSRMSSKGVRPNLKTLTSVAGACLAAGKFELAVQVYRKIENPDGYAMCQGIEALSRNGQFTEAFEILKSQCKKRQGKAMTGKQIMRSYGTILVEALKARDFRTSETVFGHLIGQGFIPNKQMLQDIIGVFGFNDVRGIVSFEIEKDEEKLSVFRFMLFLLDSLRSRRLPVDSFVYSVTLYLGSVLEGKARLVASLIAQSKVAEGEQRLIAGPSSSSSATTMNGEAGSAAATTAFFNQGAPQTWVGILDHFYKDNSDDVKTLTERNDLPLVTVRVTARDRRRLIRAENQVSMLWKSTKSRKQAQI